MTTNLTDNRLSDLCVEGGHLAHVAGNLDGERCTFRVHGDDVEVRGYRWDSDTLFRVPLAEVPASLAAKLAEAAEVVRSYALTDAEERHHGLRVLPGPHFFALD